ncbi:MAG: RNA polymerase sigma factor [Anaerovoracaceae bacterium]|nr:RNA polymerase sigma factor [Bacillota bacterium]MDD7733432.1 RNA polymerase sigma factor [Bacillota bacterium]MDY5905787.1 RNA polymerase sigma factor [Anaerovoracaceae bacterium]
MLITVAEIKTEYGKAEGRRELERLLSGIAAGRPEDMSELYSRTRTAVYSLALSYLGNAHDAQDITQDTFVQVWERARQYRPNGSPMGWLLTVCRNLALMRIRKADRHADLDDSGWDAIPAEEKGLSVEERALLQDALALLDKNERRVVMLHAAAGMKHREIAVLLEMPLATVLSKYHRAIKKLRAFMKGAEIV